MKIKDDKSFICGESWLVTGSNLLCIILDVANRQSDKFSHLTLGENANKPIFQSVEIAYFWAKPGITTSTLAGKYLSGNTVF